MIARDDVVLAISKGGESAELKSIISFTRRFSIPLIAITCSEGSSLATAADIVLLMPNEQEACPNGLAPTTSTLMQLAIGDALAVALLEARGFPRLPSRRQAGCEPDACRRCHAYRRAAAARCQRHTDAGGDHRAVAQTFRLRRGAG
jgi:fructoselysine-6-P-deglycase FrlB-like protein